MRLFIPSIVLLAACRSDEGITKFNSLPEVNITSHSDGDEVLEGYPVTFIGTGADSNHDANQLTAT